SCQPNSTGIVLPKIYVVIIEYGRVREEEEVVVSSSADLDCSLMADKVWHESFLQMHCDGGEQHSPTPCHTLAVHLHFSVSRMPTDSSVSMVSYYLVMHGLHLCQGGCCMEEEQMKANPGEGVPRKEVPPADMKSPHLSFHFSSSSSSRDNKLWWLILRFLHLYASHDLSVDLAAGDGFGLWVFPTLVGVGVMLETTKGDGRWVSVSRNEDMDMYMTPHPIPPLSFSYSKVFFSVELLGGALCVCVA
ncbi:hypothetical protein BHE74_00057183, partial [Ensete ventricosum]